MDWYHPSDNEFDLDMTFNPVWSAHAVVDSLGWTAEMRIPFSQLRFRDQPTQVWGLNIDRWIPSRSEDVFWIPVPRNTTAWSSRMGTLVGIEGIRPPRRLEVLPYVAGNATVTSGADPANPFNPDGRTAEARIGADVKMGLGPAITIEATANPDFGQVEADPAVVNLSDFEVFFDERRPFFTERSDLLRGSGANYFYSRRIGGVPAGASGDYVDSPRASTILGATKLTGRLASGLSIGSLFAVTARELARSYDVASGRTTDVEVAPPTGFGVLRLQQEFGPNASTVGLILTGVRRDVGDSPLRAVLARHAYSGGVDWNLRLARGTYSLGGYAGFSHIAGDSAVILRQQLSSRRYYQRPDQDYVRVDSSRQSLSGYVAGLSASKNNGRHWLWDIELGAESPGFEVNDAGRLSTSDGVITGGSLTYRETQPGRVFRSYNVQLQSFGEWNYGWVRQFSFTRIDVSLTWLNRLQTFLTGWVDHPGQDERLTRGGPSMGTPRSWVTIAQVRSNFADRNTWSARVYYGENQFGGLTYRFSGSVGLRPAPRWSFSVGPNYLYDRNPRQFVLVATDSAATGTFGRRYVFATVAQNQWSAPIRFNYSMTPDLTLELYAEPFLASGRFSRHGELDQPGSSRLLIYREDLTRPASVQIPARDFNLVSMRSNAVLRWEWRPGSTLFLVWQQNRAGTGVPGARVRVGDLFDGLSADGDSFFAIKVSYWIAAR